MGLRKYVRQVRPIQENHIKPEIKVQTLLNEAQLKKADIFKRQNQTTFISLATKGELLGKDGKKLPKVKDTDSLLSAIKNAKEPSDIPNTSFETNPSFKLTDVVKTGDFGGLGGKGPSGADWENIITKHFNELVGSPNHDKNANEEQISSQSTMRLVKLLQKIFRRELVVHR